MKECVWMLRSTIRMGIILMPTSCSPFVRWTNKEEWADAVNRALEQHAIDEHIDHRSYAARGLAEQPTIHEGYIARSLEKRGVASDRCEINRQIRADNRLLRQLREQASRLAEKAAESAASSLSSIAESLENIRGGMIRLYYHLQIKEDTIGALSQKIDRMTPAVREYEAAGSKLSALQKERNALRKEKKVTGFLSPLKSRRLQQQINLPSEEIEEMRSQRIQLMHRLDFEDTKEMTSAAHRLQQYRDQLNALKEQKMDLTYQIGQESERFDKAKRSVPPEHELELIHQRLSLRKKLQDSLSRSLKARSSTPVHCTAQKAAQTLLWAKTAPCFVAGRRHCSYSRNGSCSGEIPPPVLPVAKAGLTWMSLSCSRALVLWRQTCVRKWTQVRRHKTFSFNDCILYEQNLHLIDAPSQNIYCKLHDDRYIAQHLPAVISIQSNPLMYYYNHRHNC